MIYFGTQNDSPILLGVGYGIMLYGAIYGIVHEVIIHRRWRFFRGKGWYFRALIIAHRDHHKVTTKEGATNFGMLWVTPKYFELSRKKYAP
jgi:beta-carotene 3-hydroxylase